MAEEEAPASESTITEVQPSAAAAADASNEATIESCAQGGSESTCNNNGGDKTTAVAETSAATSDAGGEKSLELADQLMANGSKALKDSDYAEAVECFSRALEIRVAHYGELSPECVQAYYKYGCALLYKAQEEADPLGSVPKKEGESKQDSVKDGSAKNVINGESSAASASKKEGDDGSENNIEGVANNVSNGSDEEEGDEDSDADDVAEADEDETDLDLAWKMLDVARAIAEKQSGDTMEKVDILSALAEVAMEREDLEISLTDYKKALSTLERLVELDSRHIAELNFRICLCLEIGVNPKEAILYCQKAMSVCQARMQRLINESKNVSESASSSSTASGTDNQAEIETLTGLASDLEKKLEDLQQMASSTQSILSQLLGFPALKPKDSEQSASLLVSTQSASPISTAARNGDSSTPTVSTAQGSGSSGVTHLGVVGRGVKRVVMNSGTGEPSPPKKPALDSSEDKK